VKKIISLFQRNYETNRRVRDEIVPGAEWVLAGDGVATRKYDGVCVLIRDGTLYKRYEIKVGRKPPDTWEPADDVDDTTGKQVGWIPVGDGPEDRFMREAFDNADQEYNGTCEFLGPKSQGNVEQYPMHMLQPHAFAEVLDAPRSFDELKAWFAGRDIEGVVWHHPDGRMVKIKAKDFGIKRQARTRVNA
jgi:hypothetical protein